MKNAFYVAVFAVALLGPGAAAGEDFMLGVIVGGSLGVSEEIDDLSDASYSITGFASGRIAGPLGWRIEGGQDRFEGSEIAERGCPGLGIRCEDPRVNRVNGGLQLTGSGGPVTVYGFGTLGVYNFRPGRGEEDRTELGASYGAALNLNVLPALFVGFDLHLNTFFPDRLGGEDVDAQTYVVPGFQAGLRF